MTLLRFAPSAKALFVRNSFSCTHLRASNSGASKKSQYTTSRIHPRSAQSHLLSDAPEETPASTRSCVDKSRYPVLLLRLVGVPGLPNRNRRFGRRGCLRVRCGSFREIPVSFHFVSF